MSLGTLLVVIAIVLAVLSIFVAGPLLVASVITGFVGVLVGAAPLVK